MVLISARPRHCFLARNQHAMPHNSAKFMKHMWLWYLKIGYPIPYIYILYIYMYIINTYVYILYIYCIYTLKKNIYIYTIIYIIHLMVYQNISSRWLLTGYAIGTMCSPDSIITTRISPHPQNSWLNGIQYNFWLVVTGTMEF